MIRRDEPLLISAALIFPLLYTGAVDGRGVGDLKRETVAHADDFEKA